MSGRRRPRPLRRTHRLPRAGDLQHTQIIEAVADDLQADQLRELERQRAWARQATRALNDYRADEVEDEEEPSARPGAVPGAVASGAVRPLRAIPGGAAESEVVEREDMDDDLDDEESAEGAAGSEDGASSDDDDDEALADVVRMRAGTETERDEGPVLRVRGGESILPTLRGSAWPKVTACWSNPRLARARPQCD